MGHWVVVWVVGLLAAIGLYAVCWVVAGWAERAADWWRRDRVTPLLEDETCICGPDFTGEDIDINPGCPVHGDEGWGEEYDQPPLPPERTWEQMTSHQYPGLSPSERADFSRREKARWTRAAVVEVQQRQAYEALGLEFPSGLMARVREAAQ